MKRISTLILALVLLTSANWRTDFDKAKTDAASQNKYILLKFSGSDWCLPCIKMEKKIFDQQVFESYAADKLILVNADFPQQKKNKPAKEVEEQNERLAEQYNKNGKFPLTLLLKSDGSVVKTWEGYKDGTPEAFINEIKAALHE